MLFKPSALTIKINYMKRLSSAKVIGTEIEGDDIKESPNSAPERNRVQESKEDNMRSDHALVENIEEAPVKHEENKIKI